MEINKNNVMLYDVYEDDKYIGRMIGRHIVERYLGENAKTKGIKVSNISWPVGVQIIPTNEIINQHTIRMSYRWCREWDKARMAILKFKKEAGGNGQKS